METTVDSGMCRCCASEGLFKDVNTTYHWMGEDEVYADMLHFCFDITLASAEGQNNGGICEVCITQLRNAANFKKQVQHTEEQFKKRLAQVNSYKPEVIKVEMSVEDGAESDNNLSEDYQSGPEFEVPIKEESPEPKPKKRAAKATTSKAKKVKTDSGETSTKRNSRSILETEENLESDSILIETKNNEGKLAVKEPIAKKWKEIEKHRANVHHILSNSNATPIRCRGSAGYACCFCSGQYPNPADLKQHSIENHENINETKYMKRKDMHKFNIQMDITGLCCRLCDRNIDSIELLMEHLKNVHKKKVFTDIKVQLIPFKFESDILKCYICGKIFPKFQTLRHHMNEHYSNYKCNECEAGFVCQSMLHEHSQIHKLGTFKCDICPKVFSTFRKKRSHEKGVHSQVEMKNKCPYCDEKFKHYRQKERHMAEAHEKAFPPLKCKACEKSFFTQSSLSIHVKRFHLVHRPHKCLHCDKHFFSMAEVRLHLPTHTGVRTFECDICHKTYGLRKTLNEHMRIHMNDKRHKCELCGQAFIQKNTWRVHVRAKHGTVV